jgi:hypothetical protein
LLWTVFTGAIFAYSPTPIEPYADPKEKPTYGWASGLDGSEQIAALCSRQPKPMRRWVRTAIFSRFRRGLIFLSGKKTLTRLVLFVKYKNWNHLMIDPALPNKRLSKTRARLLYLLN